MFFTHYFIIFLGANINSNKTIKGDHAFFETNYKLCLEINPIIDNQVTKDFVFVFLLVLSGINFRCFQKTVTSLSVVLYCAFK